MKNTQQNIRVGFFFILGLALTWVTYETLSGQSFLVKEPGYTLIVGFEDLKSLKVSDEVRMAGVRIGKVEKIILAGRRAEAVLRILPEYTGRVAKDSVATISMSGLIGSNYISISLGTTTAGVLPPGAEITTDVVPDLASVMKKLDDVGQKLQATLGSIGDLTKGKAGQPGLFEKIDTMLSENQSRIAQTVTNINDITGKLSRGEGTFGKLINSSQLHDDLLTAVRELRSGAVDARSAIANFQDISTQVKSGKGMVGALLYDETAAANLKVTAANIRAVSDKIAKGEGSLGQLINDDSLVRDARSTLQKADRALDSMEDSGPINAVGVVAKSLF